jgi:S-DNA-T family DNA segregation ATPase FtsK/SpoIIIE
MTANENEPIQPMGNHGDQVPEDVAVEQALARFRNSLHRLRDDPAEAARIDAIIAEFEKAGPLPLRESPTLNQVLPPLGVDSERGLTVTTPDLPGTLRVAVGVVGKPLEEWRDPLWLDLAGYVGNVAVVGEPQSGKSTTLRTLIMSLVLTHTPREAQFYCLDFGGGSLTSLRDLPHVGGVATWLDASSVRRTVAEMAQLVDGRKLRFAQSDIDSMATYRWARRSGRYADDPFGDAFLVIDGWSSIRTDFEDLEPTITDIANHGLAYGVHVVATAARWTDFRPYVRDLFGTKLELRLSDPSGSLLNPRSAAKVPERSPGSGVAPNGLHLLVALPRIDSRQDTADLAAGQGEMVRAVREAYRGPEAPPVRLLPANVSLDAMPRPSAKEAGLSIPIGLAETNLQPAWMDFRTEPHALLFGAPGSGKSTFLRTLGRSIVDRNPPDKVRIIVVDYRRSLLADIPPSHLIGYGTSPNVTKDIIAQVCTVLRERMPGPSVTSERLRNRSWWHGPEVFVLVDDYDLVASGPTNPIAPLLEYLAQSRDVGLHLVVTRRSSGARQVMTEPVIQRLLELKQPRILLSGGSEEDPLLRSVRMGPQPPGRGWLVTRRGEGQEVQLANQPASG